MHSGPVAVSRKSGFSIRLTGMYPSLFIRSTHWLIVSPSVTMNRFFINGLLNVFCFCLLNNKSPLLFNNMYPHDRSVMNHVKKYFCQIIICGLYRLFTIFRMQKIKPDNHSFLL